VVMGKEGNRGTYGLLGLLLLMRIMRMTTLGSYRTGVKTGDTGRTSRNDGTMLIRLEISAFVSDD